MEESILVARKATTLDATDADAWWQLALSTRDRDGIEAALPALAEVTKLAPDFPQAWYELGRGHHQATRLDQAISAYELALELDSEHISSMRMLAFALKGKKENGVSARRLVLLRTIFDRDQLDTDDTFDLAYLLAEANETAEAANVYEHYTRHHSGAVGFYNLALNYRALGRDADALDALEAARRDGYDTENQRTVLAGLQKCLLTLRQQVARKPQPYLSQDGWYQHYVNPFSLLNVEPHEVAASPKALQKAKQALLREVELEDGRVDWLPGLVIDKSTAMARVTELDNSDAWDAHQKIYENPALNDFLARGSLEHFLINEDGSSHATLPHLLDVSMLERIGPKFASQFDDVLSRACQDGDLAAVECLLDGRRWVTPAQQDACFESTRRLLNRLREPLVKLAAEADSQPFTRADVEKAFEHGNLRGLLTHLPIEFYQSHSEVGIALRGLSVTFYNRTRDAEDAKAILSLGYVCAQKSPALAHQMEEDERTLNQFIAEEKSKEARLNFKDRSLAITKAGIEYGDQKLAAANITGVRWGLVQTVARPETVRHTIAFQGRSGPDIVVSWTTSSNLEEQQKFWGGLVDATLAFFADPVLASLTARLEKRELTRVGPLEIRKEGVVLSIKGWLGEKQMLVPWSRVSSVMSSGSLVVSDTTNAKATAVLPLETTYNAIFLHMLANRKDSASS